MQNGVKHKSFSTKKKTNKQIDIINQKNFLPVCIVTVLFFSILNKIVNTIVDISNIPVRTPNKIKTFFFNEATTGIGSLQGNKGFNV
jgi:hypothetical protein